jgi:hypothetical protein
MLRKMYLVSEDQINKTSKQNSPPPPPSKIKKEQTLRRVSTKRKNRVQRRKNNSQHDYETWLKMRHKNREDEIRRDTQIKAIADFLQKVLPQGQPLQQKSKNVSFKTEPGESRTESRRRLSFAPSPEAVYESLPSTSTLPPDVLYETPKSTSSVEIQSDDDTDVSPEIAEHVREFGRKHFGELASPYLTPYIYNKRFLDKQYGIRKEADGTFTIGNAPLSVDNDSNITIYGRQYSGTKSLW